MIKAVIFDFAGVIGEDGYWVWLREHLPEFESNKALFHKTSEQVDKGDISEKEFVGIIAKHTQKPVEEIWPGVREKIIINKELLTIINQLHKNYKTALLSNFVFEWLHEILTHHQLYDLFDEVIISSQHKLIKPEPAIYLKMLDMLHVNPDEAFFIDDRQYQIDAAKALGIKAVLFTNNKKLKKDLTENGIQL